MLDTVVFGEFFLFVSADPLKLHQVGWGASLHSYFQFSPEMFDRFQVQALAGRLKDIHRLVPKPLLRCLGSVSCWKVNLCLQYEVLSTLEQVFIKDLSVLWSVHLSLDPSCRCHHHASP